MKKLFILIFTVIIAVMGLYGCDNKVPPTSSRPNTPNQDTSKPDPEPNIEVSEITIICREFYWDLLGDKYISAVVRPFEATNKSVTWSSSDKDVVSTYYKSSYNYNLDKYIGEEYLRFGKPGKVTLTATASNGVSASVEIEVRQTLFYDIEFPLVISKGSGYNLRQYTITSLEYNECDDYRGSGYLLISGSKTYDAQGDNHAQSDSLLDININNKDNVKTETKYLRVTSLLNGDKFEEKLYITIDDKGAPYTMKFIVNI